MTPDELVQSVRNVNMKQAEQIIKGAKYLLLEMIETNQERLDAMKLLVKPKQQKERHNNVK